MKVSISLPSEVKLALLQNDLGSLQQQQVRRGKSYGKQGKSLLHYVSKYSADTEIANYCIKSLKIKPDSLTKRQRYTPLHICCIYGNLNIANLLLTLPTVNLETKDAQGETPVLLSAKHSHTDLCIYLHQKSADIHTTDKKKWTPLHWACKNGNYLLAEYLLQAGANANALTMNEENCLHLAAESGSVNTLILLLGCVFPLLLSKKGTLLHHSRGYPPMVDFILENTEWRGFPKLPILLEVNASVNSIVKHCSDEIKGFAYSLVLSFDRADVIKELYFKHYLTEETLLWLSQNNMRENCKNAIISLSRWQSVKKLLFVCKYAKNNQCILRLPMSLIKEIISCM